MEQTNEIGYPLIRVSYDLISPLHWFLVATDRIVGPSSALNGSGPLGLGLHGGTVDPGEHRPGGI